MTMKFKHILTVSAAMLLALQSASAQNLDPTVVVNKTYEGKIMQVHKPSFEMAVPDSLTKFELDFDYLVFEKPYKGAEGFSPYVFNMKPAAEVHNPKKLFLNVGAGYTAHPTLDLVWSPFRSKSFRMDVYASNRSYVGKYWDLQQMAPSEGAAWKGYDLKSDAGVDMRYEAGLWAAGLDVSYYGLAAKDYGKSRMYDALDVKLGVSSRPQSGSYFKYDVQAAYRFAKDKLNYGDASYGRLAENVVDLDVSMGQVFNDEHGVMVDLDVDYAVYSHDTLSSSVGQVAIVPRYVLQKGLLTLDAGVRIAPVIRSKKNDGLFGSRGQLVYPDVKVWFKVIPDAMRLYAFIGGGNKINTYASLLEKNHHFGPSFAMPGHALMDVTVERLSASVGLEGHIGSIFSYDLRTGYVNYANALLDAAVIADQYLPAVGYGAYQKYYAAFDWCLDTEPFRFDGNVVYTNAWGLEGAEGLFLPAALTADVSAEYNWKRRIYAGVDCELSTARSGAVIDIPGFVDLGVYFEYVLNRRFSVWARGGNLLNMTIQRNPLYAEKGVSATVGICLNL